MAYPLHNPVVKMALPVENSASKSVNQRQASVN